MFQHFSAEGGRFSDSLCQVAYLHLTNAHGTGARVLRCCTDFEKPQGRAAVAALLRHAQHLGSLHRYALSRDVAGYLELEVAGRVVEVYGEGTAVRIATVTESKRLTEVDGSQEGSVGVVLQRAVNELENPVRSALPRPQAHKSSPRINIRVVNLGPADIPDLVRILEGLISDCELGVPKANDGRVLPGVVPSRSRVLLYRAGLSLYGSCRRGHRGQRIAARR